MKHEKKLELVEVLKKDAINFILGNSECFEIGEDFVREITNDYFGNISNEAIIDKLENRYKNDNLEFNWLMISKAPSDFNAILLFEVLGLLYD